MSFRVRPARPADFAAIYEMAKLTGGGFTNLPADKGVLVEKIARSEESFASAEEQQRGDLYLFVLEDPERRLIRGTCQVFGAVGTDRPFYSYRISTLTQHSQELGKTFRNQTLNLTTDLEGCSEVGGLFLHPGERAGGWGALLARSRYLFIAAHRQRFGSCVLAELRGVMDQGGHSPFWDALAGRFFGMTFPEADAFNAVNGTQFIADLMPKTPVYVAMLPDTAQAVMGQPHPTGRAALRMLQEENFKFDCYIDIFDGGPTVTASVDDIQTIRARREFKLAEVAEDGSHKMIVSAGRLTDFAATFGHVRIIDEGSAALDARAVKLLGIEPGQTFHAAPR
ncbi:arginine N-succinyltransferase [Sphingomonas ginkgonis]|uniref:Arginine N-succinyltransferase n=1 Tax=Sphingomonas ginkgonis TaxID=2315330 RepID=A0A3R9YLR5_9SPHN|nr:arginine N-succinyltransferase [Sphingomonas ginkgonis]RST30396.1 arginine N-succinyltransferase [Sphingomonas ginkgonis]